MDTRLFPVKRNLLDTAEPSAPLPEAQLREVMAPRLKALTQRVATLERHAAQGGELSPTLIAALSYVDAHLKKIEGVFPTRKRVGRPKKSDEELHLLCALVDEIKLDPGFKTDKAAIEHIVDELGHKGTKANQTIKTMQHQLIRARKLPT